MARSITVRKMIDLVRSKLDEQNNVELDDDGDILPALNEGLDFACGILSRQYSSPLITSYTFAPTAGEDTYPIPEDAFSEGLTKVEVKVGGYYREVKRVSYRDVTYLESPTTGTPLFYVVEGNDFRLLPPPASISSIRIWYVKQPDVAVKEHGRVTLINTAQNYVLLASVEEPDVLSEDIESEESFVNLVDGATGEIKVSLQIASVDGQRVSFRTTPSQSTVQGRNVSGSIPSTVEKGDYLCPIDGSCIPIMRYPITHFLINHAVAIIQAVKFGAEPGVVLSLQDKFEAEVKRSWAGKELSMRVRKTSGAWAAGIRRNLWGRIR